MIHTVIWLRSTKGVVNKCFPYLESATEADQEEDWASPLTSIERPEIVLATILPEEVQRGLWMRPEQPGSIQFQTRVNREFGRSDLRATWQFISMKYSRLAPHARAVSEFPKVPERGYMDVFSPGRHAPIVRRESLKQFQEQGGLFSEYRNG